MFLVVYVNDNAIFFVVDVIGHMVEKDSVREIEKNGRKSKVIDLTLEDLE